ncbi:MULTISPECIES: TetR family transcriptional regulator [unclassified Nocardioides]|uniref:TetR family transcriptional regulator n=1 Tax=unclassified Nocardioides TaxID=2615069 RepID=UPI0007035FDF|nr:MULTISPECIES: TetR family transcriptional regulator [unclassified Nocardioides]KRC59469.1 TetR family transcriptional regulator [Nocardioides sp. Root79]KRC68709.1 TetR family transcriptional regulator [Nocardioides sp. Root240]
MPRIAEARQPAEPTSAEQKDRYRRILRAASKLGAEHGLERMQMNDVAKEAGVAIATLYRYFPSKTDLFVGVLHSQIQRLSDAGDGDGVVPSAPAGERAAAVADVLIGAGRGMLARPQLAMAMLQANNAAQLQGGREYTEANAAFHGVLLRALGVEEPADEDFRMVRITEQTWYGVLVSVLNGVITIDQADADIRLATKLLLGPRYDEEAGS